MVTQVPFLGVVSIFRLPPKYRLNGLNEKFILKQAAKNFIPQALIERPKQPYRAPISQCFLGDSSPDYVSELLSERAIEQNGYFDSKKVSRLLAKCKRHEVFSLQI